MKAKDKEMMFRIDPKTVPTIDRVANPSVRIKLLGVKERMIKVEPSTIIL